jgi:hypothetical protein
MTPMPEDEIERKITLLQAAWRYFDEVAGRVSPELARGPRGGGRSRDEIIRHALGWERADLIKRVGIVVDPVVPDVAEGLRSHREQFVSALRTYNAEDRVPRGQNWTVSLLLRHTAFHVLDHAWEMEDKDLSGG